MSCLSCTKPTIEENKSNIIKQAQEQARREGKQEMAIVQKPNGSGWFIVEVTDERCGRLKTEYVRV